MKEIISRIDENMRNLHGNIQVLDMKVYGESKVEFVLILNKHMASLSILSDYTYDFMIIEMSSEEVKHSVTKSNESIELLISSINSEMEVFENSARA